MYGYICHIYMGRMLQDWHPIENYRWVPQNLWPICMIWYKVQIDALHSKNEVSMMKYNRQIQLLNGLWKYVVKGIHISPCKPMGPGWRVEEHIYFAYWRFFRQPVREPRLSILNYKFGIIMLAAKLCKTANSRDMKLETWSFTLAVCKRVDQVNYFYFYKGCVWYPPPVLAKKYHPELRINKFEFPNLILVLQTKIKVRSKSKIWDHVNEIPTPDPKGKT